MQFFPVSSSGSVSALGGVSLASANAFMDYASGGANEFLKAFNEQLAESGVAPIVDDLAANGPPSGFRAVKRDVSARLDDEDVSFILEKLRERGTEDTALAGLETMLAARTAPTLGNVMAALGGDRRVSEDLTDDELRDLDAALRKLRFSPDEADELFGLMRGGKGLEAMRVLRDRAREMGASGLALNGNETRAILRGLDLSEKTMQKAAALFGANAANAGTGAAKIGNTETGTAEINGDMLEALLGPAAEELAARRAEGEKLAGELKGVIDEALQAKKIREATAPVADTRGSRKADRAETLMRDDMTAKANGLGQDGKEAPRQAAEEEALADEDAARRDPRESGRESGREAGRESKRTAAGEPGTVLARAVAESDPAGDSGRDAAAKSGAREGFSSIAHRMDGMPGMAAPAQQNAAAGQQDPSAVFAQPREIFSQVEQGMLRQLQDGTRQMTLRLDPAELGQLTVILSVKSGEVRAMIRAENPETTALLSEQMQQLRQTLEEQGLKVASLDVETQLPQDTTREQFPDMAQFGREQEMREQARFLQLAKLRREAGKTLAQDMQSKDMREENAASGLHIIA